VTQAKFSLVWAINRVTSARIRLKRGLIITFANKRPRYSFSYPLSTIIRTCPTTTPGDPGLVEPGSQYLHWSETIQT
jgi:hypothetical protein